MDALLDWTYSSAIGFAVVSFWRGTWVLWDVYHCQQPSDATLVDGTSFCFAVDALVPGNEDSSLARDVRLQSARLSYGVGLALLLAGVAAMWMGWWIPKSVAVTTTNTWKFVGLRCCLQRFVIVYALGHSAVGLWRGIWYWADAWILPLHPLASYWTTSLVGAAFCFVLGAGNSLLAPPAMFLLDGPSLEPPPLAVTLASSYYSLTTPVTQEENDVEKTLRRPLQILDILVSFIALPFGVVWFWRGTWMLMDHYFWGFTLEDRDVHWSLLENLAFFVVCLVLTSEPVLAWVGNRIQQVHERHAGILLAIVGRLRTWILALGTVGFWRVVWLLWDEFLGGTTEWSGWLSHAGAILLLTTMGCVSSINAPASTVGVDALPHPKCADEPLFSNTPLPWELLHAFAIARQPSMMLERQASFLWAADNSQRVRELSKKKKHDEDESLTSRGEMIPKATISDSINKTLHADNRSRQPAEIEMVEQHEQSGGEAEQDETASAPPAIPLPESVISQGRLVSGTDSLSSLRTWSYLDMQRPGNNFRQCTSYTQRPGMDNKRSRSVFFRSR